MRGRWIALPQRGREQQREAHSQCLQRLEASVAPCWNIYHKGIEKMLSFLSWLDGDF